MHSSGIVFLMISTDFFKYYTVHAQQPPYIIVSNKGECATLLYLLANLPD